MRMCASKLAQNCNLEDILSRHFHGDIRTAIIIRNIKTSGNLIELLDTFDQAGPSNTNSRNNGYNLYQKYRSHPNVYGETAFLDKNNFRWQNNASNRNRSNRSKFRREWNLTPL